MPRCKKCPAVIRFCKTPDGNWMPLDLEPNEEGDYVLDGQNDHGDPLVRRVDLFTAESAPRYMPHWATCPNADDFRGDG